MTTPPFDVGDLVVRLGPSHNLAAGVNGIIVFVVPAMASPYRIYARWLKDRGQWRGSRKHVICRDHESYIMQVDHPGNKTVFYWPTVLDLRKRSV